MVSGLGSHSPAPNKIYSRKREIQDQQQFSLIPLSFFTYQSNRNFIARAKNVLLDSSFSLWLLRYLASTSQVLLSLSLCLDVFNDIFWSSLWFFLYYKTVVTPLLLSENRSWLCLVDLSTRSFSPTSQFMIWVLNVVIKFVLSEKSYQVLN